ncbi:MAG: glycoside hydrolase family 6 protein [bacterium]|nr:glycoside hydrolase family 6 protein [bacterium]
MKYSRSLKTLFSTLGKLSLIAILWLGGVYAFDAINKTNYFGHTVTTGVSADGNINIWWPKNNAHIDNTQAFKAQVQDKDISEYTMTWSVDGDEENKMDDSMTDYPHKESVVNLKNWNWKGSGPYKVTFRAVDKDNKEIGKATVDIFTPEPAQGPTSVESGHESNDSESTIETPSQTVKDVISKVSGITIAAADTVNIPDVETQPIDILTPSKDATLAGVHNFEARLGNENSSKYKMFWKVDDGQKNSMTWEGNTYRASVDVSGWNWKDNGQYKITFVAEDNGGRVVSTSDVRIQKGTSTTKPVSTDSVQITPVTTQPTQPTTQPTPTPTPIAAPVVGPTPVVSSSGNPFSGAKLWLNPNTDAKKTADSWRSSRPQDAAQMDKIASSPDVIWLGGWNHDISGFVKEKVKEVGNQGALPVFIAYNIPGRDCGQYSAGGVGSADEYRGWIRKIADSIGSSKAVVIIEPDGTTLTDCLGSRAGERYSLIKDAVSILKSKSNIAVYIDAGHPGWISADDMASRLNQSGIAQANGFALNISNFNTTQNNVEYGTKISQKTGGKHFVIDTGRNGLGPTADNQWCNPSGRALGAKPTTNTGNSLVDAFLWVKGPGGSDGNCNGGPNAGVWWPEYALDMARRSAI